MTRLDANLMAESVEPHDRRIKLPARRRHEPPRLDTHRALPDLGRSWAEVQPALRAVLRRLAQGEARWPLYLHGEVGTGKTRAVLAFCDTIQFGRFWTVEGLKDLMIARKAPWDWGVSPYLAALDELGAHVAKDFEYDAVKKFADWREDQPTIYVSNQPPRKMIDLYDRRIASRLTCGTMFELVDRDRRQAIEQAADANGGEV